MDGPYHLMETLLDLKDDSQEVYKIALKKSHKKIWL